MNDICNWTSVLRSDPGESFCGPHSGRKLWNDGSGEVSLLVEMVINK